MTARTLAKRTGNFLLGTLFIAACCFDPFPVNAAEPTDTVEVFWSLPDGGTPEHVTYPQTYSPDGATTPGVCYQIDTYLAHEAALFTADNTLVEGEDYADVNGPGTGVQSWRFECVAATDRATTAADQSATKSGVLAETGGIPQWLYLPIGLVLGICGGLLIRVAFGSRGDRA